jgi:hypothetical protein
MRLGLTVYLFSAIALPAFGQEPIAAAKRVPARSLDSTLPSVPFETWLADLRGIPTSAIRWEVNDCGEGSDGRLAPTCVEAILPLAADTIAHVSLIVDGLDGARSNPTIWDLSVGAGYSFTGFKTLREWAARVVASVKDTVPRDTGLGTGTSAAARTFNLQAPGQRDSLLAVLKRERQLWRASRPRDYRFLLQVGCFCPGTRGWLVMEVRGSELRARDRAGKPVPLTDWNTFSIDGLFDMLERSVDRDAVVQVGFDPRRHFPAYVRTVARPGPDAWTIIEAREWRPL